MSFSVNKECTQHDSMCSPCLYTQPPLPNVCLATVGDPLKDTSGPALNILIKLMAVESLVRVGEPGRVLGPSFCWWRSTVYGLSLPLHVTHMLCTHTFTSPPLPPPSMQVFAPFFLAHTKDGLIFQLFK
jgi:hypothetical protein